MTWPLLLICSAIERADASKVRSVTTPAVVRALPYATHVFTTTMPASGISSHPRSWRRRLLTGIVAPKHVAEAAQRHDSDVASLELLAHAVNVDLDCIRIHVVIKAEYGLGERALAHGLARMLDQCLQHGVFARRQWQADPAEGELATVAVEGERAIVDGRILPVARPPQLRAYPGLKLAQVERFGEVVVGATVES